MSWFSHLDVGMPVYATDGLLGAIASVPRTDPLDPSAPAEVSVLASEENAGPGVDELRRVTREMIDRVDRGTVYLNVARHDVPAASGTLAAEGGLGETGERITIPLVEEELAVGRRVVELGYLQVRKSVDEHIDERYGPLRYQEVEVERVPIDQVIPEVVQPYMDGDVYVVPVIEEEVIVRRQLRLKEELRIHRVVGSRDEIIRTPIRREVISIEEHWHEPTDQPERPSE